MKLLRKKSAEKELRSGEFAQLISSGRGTRILVTDFLDSLCPPHPTSPFPAYAPHAAGCPSHVNAAARGDSRAHSHRHGLDLLLPYLALCSFQK